MVRLFSERFLGIGTLWHISNITFARLHSTCVLKADYCRNIGGNSVQTVREQKWPPVVLTQGPSLFALVRALGVPISFFRFLLLGQ